MTRRWHRFTGLRARSGAATCIAFGVVIVSACASSHEHDAAVEAGDDDEATPAQVESVDRCFAASGFSRNELLPSEPGSDLPLNREQADVLERCLFEAGVLDNLGVTRGEALENTSQAETVVACMRGSGWAFADPVPAIDGEAEFLIPPTFTVPEDDKQAERFESDIIACAGQAGLDVSLEDP